MSHRCDVCHNFRPSANARVRPLASVRFGDAIVVLCGMHRRIAERLGVTTFEELRELYGESGEGRRSYVPRRTRTAQTPPTGEERRSGGRRASDAIGD